MNLITALGASTLLLCIQARWHGYLARLNGTVVIPVSSVPCLRKSLLRLRVLVMKKQSMLAGQSAVFSSVGCEKSCRAFKGLACEVPTQDGDMFVFSPPFASFTWNARKKNPQIKWMVSGKNTWTDTWDTLEDECFYLNTFSHFCEHNQLSVAVCCKSAALITGHPGGDTAFDQIRLGKILPWTLNESSFALRWCVLPSERSRQGHFGESSLASFRNRWMFGKYSGPGCPQVKERKKNKKVLTERKPKVELVTSKETIYLGGLAIRQGAGKRPQLKVQIV